MIPVDGVAPKEKTGDTNSTTPRNVRRGESGAGPPALRAQHVEVRVEESRAGEPADQESDESGEQTTQSTRRCGSTLKNVQCSTAAQRRE